MNSSKPEPIVREERTRKHMDTVPIHSRSPMARPCLETDSSRFSPAARWVTLGHLMVLFDLQLLARSQDKSQSQGKKKTSTMLLMLPVGKMGEFFPPLHRPQHFLHGGTSCITLTRQMSPERSGSPVQIHSHWSGASESALNYSVGGMCALFAIHPNVLDLE